VVGNEDGAHHIIAEAFQALNEAGFTIPVQGATYWNGRESTASTTAAVARNAAHLTRALKRRSIRPIRPDASLKVRGGRFWACVVGASIWSSVRPVASSIYTKFLASIRFHAEGVAWFVPDRWATCSSSRSGSAGLLLSVRARWRIFLSSKVELPACKRASTYWFVSVTDLIKPHCRLPFQFANHRGWIVQ
jgi:hypothetical protein